MRIFIKRHGYLVSNTNPAAKTRSGARICLICGNQTESLGRTVLSLICMTDQQLHLLIEIINTELAIDTLKKVWNRNIIPRQSCIQIRGYSLLPGSLLIPAKITR